MSRAERFLRRISQYTRTRRHAWSVARHGTPRKWANLARVESERKLRRIQLKGHPYLLIIDPCNYCNLRCPLCPTGVGELGRPQAFLSFEHFQKYFDPFAPYLFEAYLHNWGESLLNKQVYRMIEYAQSRNVGTNLSSNLFDLDSQDFDNLLDCGLEYLVVSLDGTSEQSYSQYRIRGSFQRVFDNLSELLRRRAARRQKLPFVEWQFIVMKPNEHEVQQAERLARQIGVDLLRFIPVGMPFEFANREETARQWFPTTIPGRAPSTHEERQFGQGAKPGPCFYLYRSMVINPDGGVSPCCVVYRKERDFAQLDGPVEPMAIWNNPRYLSARSLFSTRAQAEHVPTVCDQCDLFERPAGAPLVSRGEYLIRNIQPASPATKERTVLGSSGKRVE
jgi:MoaA/NifB/PqqE/SkfB family radical SAM enzyme